MKRKPPSALKLRTYKKHWKRVRRVQDELSAQYIHHGIKLGEITDETQLAYATVHRFFHFGRTSKLKGYSLFHGPSQVTVDAIADAIGMEFKLVSKQHGTRHLRRTSNGHLKPASTSTTSTGSRPPSKKP